MIVVLSAKAAAVTAVAIIVVPAVVTSTVSN